jgi:DNA-binding XRE family transcriptional regulator
MHFLARVRENLARLPTELAAAYHQRYQLGVSQDAAALAIGISRQRLRTLEKKLLDGVIRELRVAGTTEPSTKERSSVSSRSRRRLKRGPLVPPR